MQHLNVEIKAHCDDVFKRKKIKEILDIKGADSKGTDHQIDTYFNVRQGRLKLREGNIENYLIFYERADQAGPKESKVTLVDLKPNSPLKECLVNSLGILVTVDKRREIYFIGNVKFHIDLIDRLGGFIEIEAIDKDCSVGKEKLYEQCREYLDLFGLRNEDLIEKSYSDLLLEKTKTG